MSLDPYSGFKEILYIKYYIEYRERVFNKNVMEKNMLYRCANCKESLDSTVERPTRIARLRLERRKKRKPTRFHSKVVGTEK